MKHIPELLQFLTERPLPETRRRGPEFPESRGGLRLHEDGEPHHQRPNVGREVENLAETLVVEEEVSLSVD